MEIKIMDADGKWTEIFKGKVIRISTQNADYTIEHEFTVEGNGDVDALLRILKSNSHWDRLRIEPEGSNVIVVR